MNRTLIATLVTAAFSAVSPSVLAESADNGADASIVVAQASPQRAPEASSAPRQAREMHAVRKPSERIEARLAYARTALKITPAQQPQWEGFANVLRKHAADMDQRFEQRRVQGSANAARPDARQMSAIERLEQRQQRMAERSAQLNEVLTAAKPLYAAFTPEQKQIADTMLARRGHGGQRDGHHGRGRHGART